MKLFDASWHPKVAMCNEAGIVNISSTSCLISSGVNAEFESKFQASSTLDKLFPN